MNLQKLADQDLLDKTKTLVAQEYQLLSVILCHLQEVERRRLFASLGYSSLFTYAVQQLGYSEDQAFRRISAMRLMKALPAVEEKIKSGTISLSNLTLAQTLFRRQEKAASKISADHKMEILKKLENKSSREAQEIVMELLPETASAPKDQIRLVGRDQMEIPVIVSKATLAKIEKIKGLMAHTHPNITLAELIDSLCDRAIEDLDPALKKVKSPAPSKVRMRVPEAGGVKVGRAKMRQQIWKRAHSQCETCKSQYALEIDHIQPKALGGSDEPHNLRLLCRNCNQRAAIEKLGLEKMDRYLR